MIIRGFCAACVAWVLAVAASAMDSRFVGTWKLNYVKSKLEGSGIDPDGKGRARLEPDGSGFKGSVESVTPQGQSISYTYPLTLDGKTVKVTSVAPFDEVESSRVNDRLFDVVTKKKRPSCIFRPPQVVKGRQNHHHNAQRNKCSRPALHSNNSV